LKKLLVLVMLVLAPVLAHAADPRPDRPHWSVEIKGGVFEPALPDFKKYYDKSTVPEFAGSLAYKVIRQIDIGLSAGYLQAKGRGDARLNNMLAGNVTLKLAPINAFVLFRGVMSEEQWLVPYIGGGFTRMYYQERIDGQDTINGSVDGYHARGGLQFVLDALDPKAASSMYRDYGMFHTSLFFEVEYIRAVVQATSTNPEEVNLGGTAYLAGLLFEF
jgi:hypothetical protein